MDKQAIIAKIKSLKNLESRAGTQGEAEAAAYAIAAIIDRYKLSVSELEEESQEESRGQVEKQELDKQWHRLPGYKRTLLSVIARHCGVSVITVTNERGLRMRTLVGFASDVEIARHLYSWLVAEAADLSPKGHGKGYSQSWCIGFAHGIASQLRKARQQVIEEAPSAKCAAIILDKNPIVEDFVNKLFPKLVKTKYKSTISHDLAYLDGKIQGENTHLGKRLPKENNQ